MNCSCLAFFRASSPKKAGHLKGGHLTSVFGMGALSALIVGPCVAAPLAGALLYISQTRDIVLGGSALFAMALGMGVPLLLLGASAGALLPKAGPWMESIKQFFGVLLLGVAIWLISPVIPAVVHMLLWAALLIISAIYLHAVDPLRPGASGFQKFLKGLGMICVIDRHCTADRCILGQPRYLATALQARIVCRRWILRRKKPDVERAGHLPFQESEVGS